MEKKKVVPNRSFREIEWLPMMIDEKILVTS